MNKRLFFTLFLALMVIFSLSAIQAADVNGTDLNAVDSSNYTSLQVEDDYQSDVLSLSNSSDLSSNSDSSVIESNKNCTEFSSPSDNVYYKGFYSITLKDSTTNNTLSNKNVTLFINKVNYTVSTNDKGVASVNLKLNPGKYDVIASFEGDDAYDSCIFSSSFKVLPTVKASNLSKYYKGATKYTATFFTSQGSYLANRNVKVTINGKTYTKKTNSKGVVSLPVNLKPGTYKIVSTDPVTSYKVTTTFKILSTISSSSLNKVVGDSKKFTAKFFKSNGKALAGKYVKFKLNGKTYKVKTNSKGKATLSLNKLKKGTYKVICYNKDGLSKSYKIKIYKIATTKITTSFYTFLQEETKQIKAKFTTNLKDGSNSGKVIKIKINGKTYSKKTDGNGIVYLNLPALENDLYSVKYSFAGNKFFKAATATNYVTVINNDSQTELSVEGITSFGQGAGTLFEVSYTADGVPLAKRTVTFTVDGKTYAKKTDYDGIASMPINLKVGNYTIDFKTNDESKLNGTSGSCDIDVFKRNETKMVWKSASSFKDSSQTFKVLLTYSNGTPIADEEIELTIDGETYIGYTSSKGYATFKTDVPIGKYKVTVRFLGDNENVASSTSKSINVELSKFGRGLNEKNTISYLKKYLKSSSHCKVGTSKMKALIKTLTKGLTNKIDKAKAIFNYVRDTLAYRLYYNTYYGASTTLKLKKGNCVDHSHLLVALFRTAGFKARYVHGVCKFNSGHTYGHVWTQVLIGKHWVCADATSYGNDLGKITNWNTKNYKIHAKYRSLPF